MPPVLASETGMPVTGLLCLTDDDGTLMERVRWRGLGSAEDTDEPLSQVYDDVPQLAIKVINRSNTDPDLAGHART